MTDSDPRGSGELTDAQLDQLLAETNRELLENVEATSDPSRTLTAIMTRSAQQDRADRASRRAWSGACVAFALVWSCIRAPASDVAGALRAWCRWSARRPLLCSVCAAVLGTAGLAAALLAARQAHAVACRQVHATAAACRQLQTPAALATPAMVISIVACIMIICAIGFGILHIGTSWRARSGLAGGPGQALAAIMSSRNRVRLAAGLLDDAYRAPVDPERGKDPRVQHLAGARGLARQLAGELARSHDRDLADARALRAEIDRARSSARRRDRALVRFRADSLNREFAGHIAAARRIAIALARALDERQVDVSGADLSGMEIQPDLLNGAIWTHQTAWPPGVASQVRAHSTEIRPDVYQVRLGTGAAGLAGAAPSGASPA